jgi:hypothetical protein
MFEDLLDKMQPLDADIAAEVAKHFFDLLMEA